MKILGYTTSEKVGKKKVIGVYTPTSLIEYISLYSIANKTSVAAFVNKLFEDWRSEQELVEADLIQQCTDVIYQRLLELKKVKGFNYQYFFVDLERELKKRSISSLSIAQIIKNITDAEKI